MGAKKVGLAKPLLQAALVSENELDHLMSKYEFELKVAMFCTGCSTMSEFQDSEVWRWKSIN